jgi:hypothetical protein
LTNCKDYFCWKQLTSSAFEKLDDDNRHGLNRVSFDGSPVLSSPLSAAKEPFIAVTIEGLKDTYRVGDPMDFLSGMKVMGAMQAFLLFVSQHLLTNWFGQESAK